MSYLPDPLESAMTIRRAAAMTAHEAGELEEVTRAVESLRVRGYEATLERYLDDPTWIASSAAGPVALRWRLLINTPRGSIPIPLRHPSEWREALEERGL